MRNEMTLKKYDVDYSFIIRNYLSPELWKKTWTLFVYKNIRITLNLYYIWVNDPIKIDFKELDKPIITTNVSDSEQIEGQGIVVEKDETEIYKAMKDFIENGYQITKQFDAKEYNNNIFNKLQEIIG